MAETDVVKIVLKGKDEASTVVSKLDGVFGGLGKTAMAVGAAAAAAVAGMSAALYASVNAAADFEKEMANVSTLVDTSKVDMQALEKGILALDPALGSASELTKGLYQALSAGVEPAKAIEFIGTSAKLAKAGLSDTFSAVDVLTSALNSYKASSDDAAKYSDIMFKTVEQGKTTVEELASSLGRVMPIAAANKISFTELNAAVATLTKGGLQTSEAVTGLKAAISNIVKPSKDARETAEKLGIAFDSNALSTKGLTGFLAQFSNRSDITNADLAKMFGSVEALNSVIQLSGTGFKEYTKINQALANSAGATDTAVAKQTKTFASASAAAGNAFDKVKIAIGKGVLPVLTPFVQKLADLLQANKGIIAQKVTAFFKAMIPPIKNAVEGAKNLYDAFKAFLNSRLFEQIVDGFKTFIAAAVSMYNKITDVVTGVVDTVMDIVSRVKSGQMSFGDAGAAIITYLADGIKNGISSSLSYAIDGAINIIMGLLNWLLDNYDVILVEGGKIISALAKGIFDVASTLLFTRIEAVIKIVSAIATWAEDNAGALKEAGKKIVSSLADGLLDAKDYLVEKMGAALQRIKDMLPSSPPKAGPLAGSFLTDSGKEIVMMLSNGIDSETSRLNTSGEAMGQAVVDGLSSTTNSDTMNAAAVDITNNVSNAVKIAAERPIFASTLSGYIGEAFEKVSAKQGFIDNVKKISSGAIGTLVDGFIEGKQDLSDRLKSFFTDVFKDVLNKAINTALGKVLDVVFSKTGSASKVVNDIAASTVNIKNKIEAINRIAKELDRLEDGIRNSEWGNGSERADRIKDIYHWQDELRKAGGILISNGDGRDSTFVFPSLSLGSLKPTGAVIQDAVAGQTYVDIETGQAARDLSSNNNNGGGIGWDIDFQDLIRIGAEGISFGGYNAGGGSSGSDDDTDFGIGWSWSFKRNPNSITINNTFPDAKITSAEEIDTLSSKIAQEVEKKLGKAFANA